MTKRTVNMAAGMVALAIGGVLPMQNAQATVIFDFNDGTDLDNVSLASAVTTVDGLTLTTTEIIAWDGQLGSTNAAVTLNISGSNNALGVNSPTTPPNAAQDFRDFDPGEAWVFQFDQPVLLNELNVSSLDTITELTISSSAFTTFVFVDGDGGSGDDFDLLNTFVPAGTDIMIQNTSVESIPGGTFDSHDFRISELTVTVIPEPGTLGLVGSFLIGTLLLRRFRV